MPDIIKNRRSLKEILPKEMSSRSATNHLPPSDSPAPRPKNIDWYPRRRFKSKWLVYLVILVVIVVGGLSLTGLFSKATVKVTPVQGRLLLNHTFDAYAQAPEGELGFSLVSGITDTEKRLVPASGVEKVSRKASGNIIVYNNYDEKPQKLIKNTRFETAGGKIYRINEAITVPGVTVKGSERVPGSVEVTVYADQPGADYNIATADFTIPGFKNDPRYDKFYARSKTALAGGFVGEMKKVSEADKAKAIREMKEVLQTRLASEAKVQIPAGFILFNGANFVTFEEVLPEAGATSSAATAQAEVTLKGTFNGILFDRKALSFKVAKEQIPDFDGRELEIKNLDTVKFKLLNQEEIKNTTIDKVSFTLEGNAHLVWLFNQTDLINKLRTAPKDSYQSVFAQFPTIKQAEIVFFPPWSKRIPDKADKIKVEVITTD